MPFLLVVRIFCRNRMNNSTEKTDNTTTGRNAVIFKQRRNLYMKATGIVRRIDEERERKLSEEDE